MRRTPWTTYAWPGLPQLWSNGSWSGLALAVVAAVLLDLLLLASFGWSELIDFRVRNALWLAFGVAWVVAVVWSVRQSRRRAADERLGPRRDVFSDAQEYYLRGDDYQAERILESLLRQNIRDVDARLMLATLLRRAGRIDEALRQLDTLARFEGAEKWELEILDERQLLAEAKRETKNAATTETDPGPKGKASARVA